MAGAVRSPRGKGRQARSYHVGNLREGFVREALGLLDREGLDALSLRKVAAAAGVSHAAAYRHFDDKSALLAAVAEEGFGLLYEYQQQVVADCGDDLAARFLELGWIYVKFAIDHPQHARVMFSGAGPQLNGQDTFHCGKAQPKSSRQTFHVSRPGQPLS